MYTPESIIYYEKYYIFYYAIHKQWKIPLWLSVVWEDSTCGSFPKVIRTGKDAGMAAETFDVGEGLVSQRRVFPSFHLLTDILGAYVIGFISLHRNKYIP